LRLDQSKAGFVIRIALASRMGKFLIRSEPDFWRTSTMKPRAALVTAAVIATLITLVSAAWGHEKVLHSFHNHPANQAVAGLVVDSSGNLYGTTAFGGRTARCFSGCGTVFKLTPLSGGGWTYQVIYVFHGGDDGANPTGTLAVDLAGNLYGTTQAGGSNACSGGCGTVFDLTPSSGGGWTENVLYRFSGTNGQQPYAGVTLDTAGNIYGTTFVGGSGNCLGGCGVAFELTPSGGQWNETVLYSFTGGSDGAAPVAPMIFDARGNLYGTASTGGVGSCGGVTCGVVFDLTPSGSGWTENVLYSFKGGKQDGGSPLGALVFDLSGNLYGTTSTGGSQACNDGCGTIFELMPSGNAWTETVLHKFQGGWDGAVPYNVALVVDQAGALYGTTLLGGQSACNCGTAFKLTPSSNGKWSRSSLYAFDGKHGSNPDAGLIPDATGNLYGTAGGGGADGFGVVFEITP
jgi:uncharacterized repeat protein (TIGR03803 family)